MRVSALDWYLQSKHLSSAIQQRTEEQAHPQQPRGHVLCVFHEALLACGFEENMFAYTSMVSISTAGPALVLWQLATVAILDPWCPGLQQLLPYLDQLRGHYTQQVCTCRSTLAYYIVHKWAQLMQLCIRTSAACTLPVEWPNPGTLGKGYSVRHAPPTISLSSNTSTWDICRAQ